MNLSDLKSLAVIFYFTLQLEQVEIVDFVPLWNICNELELDCLFDS
jgi:hypothetical protein